MPGQHQAVRVTPVAAVFGKRFGKAVTHVIMIMIADGGGDAAFLLPVKFRQVRHQVLPVSRSKGFRQVVTPRQGYRLLTVSKAAGWTCPGKLWLIRENGGHGLAEFIAHLSSDTHCR